MSEGICGCRGINRAPAPVHLQKSDPNSSAIATHVFVTFLIVGTCAAGAWYTDYFSLAAPLSSACLAGASLVSLAISLAIAKRNHSLQTIPVSKTAKQALLKPPSPTPLPPPLNTTTQHALAPAATTSTSVPSDTTRALPPPPPASTEPLTPSPTPKPPSNQTEPPPPPPPPSTPAPVVPNPVTNGTQSDAAPTPKPTPAPTNGDQSQKNEKNDPVSKATQPNGPAAPAPAPAPVAATKPIITRDEVTSLIAALNKKSGLSRGSKEYKAHIPNDLEKRKELYLALGSRATEIKHGRNALMKFQALQTEASFKTKDWDKQKELLEILRDDPQFKEKTQDAIKAVSKKTNGKFVIEVLKHTS